MGLLLSYALTPPQGLLLSSRTPCCPRIDSRLNLDASRTSIKIRLQKRLYASSSMNCYTNNPQAGLSRSLFYILPPQTSTLVYETGGFRQRVVDPARPVHKRTTAVNRLRPHSPAAFFAKCQPRSKSTIEVTQSYRIQSTKY